MFPKKTLIAPSIWVWAWFLLLAPKNRIKLCASFVKLERTRRSLGKLSRVKRVWSSSDSKVPSLGKANFLEMKTEKTQHPINPGPMGWSLALERAPHFLAVVLIFVLPLLPSKPGMDALTPNWVLVQVLIWLMVGAWSFRVFLTGKLVWVVSRSHWVLLFLILWLLLTVVLSPCRSFCWMILGDNAIYPIWYLLLTFTCLETWRAENLLIAFLLSGLMTALWAIGQALGLGDAQSLTAIQNQFGGRVMGGLGQPDHLAVFLLVIWR